MMCQRIGLPPISTIGLGRVVVSSASRVPFPPARMTTFISVHPRFRHGSDEPPALSPVTYLLIHDLARKIPGQNEHVVRLGFLQGRYRPHRDMHSWCVM